MRLLLDTAVFIWYITKSPELNPKLVALIRDERNEVFLSIVSFWEAVIKYQLGKLPLPKPAHLYFPVERRLHRIDILNIDEASIARLPSLPDHHKDPFDRIMICQAIEHGMTLVTSGGIIREYPVQSIGN